MPLRKQQTRWTGDAGMDERGAKAKEGARAWLEFAASQYPDHAIPAELGGAWLTEISIRTGCQQQTVERIAREMRVWTASPLEVHAAQRGRIPPRGHPVPGAGEETAPSLTDAVEAESSPE